ncbi:ankyrin repeat-containing domain protein [Pyronema domesticum]|nr:ankyrin repeat-containing domain protein [Pyronema domesticum]
MQQIALFILPNSAADYDDDDDDDSNHDSNPDSEADEEALTLAEDTKPNQHTTSGEKLVPRSKTIRSRLKNSLTEIEYRIKARNGINSYDSKGYTPLHYAIKAGDITLATLLLDSGVDPNIRTYDSNGYTALHNACRAGNVGLATILLDSGADPNIRKQSTRPSHSAEDGPTPLHEAVAAGHSELIDLLLRYNAEPNMATYNDNTTIHFAARKGNASVSKRLLSIQ